MGRLVYLDWNATTPPLPEALDAMREVGAYAWANPSSVHQAGRRARRYIEEAREQIAQRLGVEARDVLFASTGTEANNLALMASTALVTSRLEHPSVVKVAESLQQQGRPVHWLNITKDGRIDPEDVDAALVELGSGCDEGTIVAVMAANHETGVIQPIAEIAECVHRTPARLHVDAVQAFGKCGAEAWQGADSVTITAHKVRGPKGIAALGWRRGKAPRPVLVGGAQERGLRPGTQDAVLAAGFLAVLPWLDGGPSRYAELARLRDGLEARLTDVAQINGNGARRLPHVSNLSVHGVRGDELVAALDLAGICVSSGAACSAGTAERSPVIEAMLGRDRAESAVRISLGDTVTPEDVALAVHELQRLAGAG